MIDVADVSPTPRCFTCGGPTPAFALVLGAIPFPLCIQCARETTKVVHEAIGKTIRRRSGEYPAQGDS